MHYAVEHGFLDVTKTCKEMPIAFSFADNRTNRTQEN